MAPAPAACHRRFEAGNLSAFPLLDRGAVKAPITANPKTGETTLPEQPVNRGRMNTEVFGELLDSKDIVPRGPDLGRTV